ncbi:MAG: DUF3795 domain-containing protein [Candidatus Cloacimonadota bacterium]|nr:DUF3795 domain-containing protein [Candidatus Cloacimonadota bacterium]
MSKMIAYCGIVCTECPAYIATKNNDEDLRKKTATEWSKTYGAEIKPENIYCDGCLQDEGHLIGHCAECEIRACGKEKKVENCAYCDDFACEKLEKFFEFVPTAKKVLENIRNK